VGLVPAQLGELEQYAKSGAYTDVEKLVIRFAEEWTRQGKASADVVAQLSKHLTPSQMVVLAATVGVANWTNRFNETFGVELP
jgi:alkylhydroperoxidase family enzyme